MRILHAGNWQTNLFLLPDFPLRDIAPCQTKLLEAAEADEPQEWRMEADRVPQGELQVRLQVVNKNRLFTAVYRNPEKLSSSL